MDTWTVLCFHGKYVTMATNIKLSNSVNWRSTKAFFSLKISFSMCSLPSNQDNHIYYSIKVM